MGTVLSTWQETRVGEKCALRRHLRHGVILKGKMGDMLLELGNDAEHVS